MKTTPDLNNEIKQMLVDNLMLKVPAETILDDQPLFGPGGLGLDSVDALQVVVALEKDYHLKLADPEAARQVLRTVNTIAAAIETHRAAPR
jgi:acyl carrier protein